MKPNEIFIIGVTAIMASFVLFSLPEHLAIFLIAIIGIVAILIESVKEKKRRRRKIESPDWRA